MTTEYFTPEYGLPESVTGVKPTTCLCSNTSCEIRNKCATYRAMSDRKVVRFPYPGPADAGREECFAFAEIQPEHPMRETGAADNWAAGWNEVYAGRPQFIPVRKSLPSSLI